MKNLTLIAIIATFLLVKNTAAQNDALSINHQNERVSITSNQIDCVDQQNGTAKAYLALSLTNNSDQQISVSFKKNMWYDGSCISCESTSDEYNVSRKVLPNETLVGSCDDNQDLNIFMRMMELEGVRQLTHAELDNITSVEL